MNKKEYAITLHDRGCNCAQSVLCSFADECGVNEETLMKLSEGFGLGGGGMAGMCGALSGALMAVSTKYADGNIEAPKSKKTTYSVAKQICAEFEKECGAIICGDIKGQKSGKPLTPCSRCIVIGVELAKKALGGEYDNN